MKQDTDKFFCLLQLMEDIIDAQTILKHSCGTILFSKRSFLTYFTKTEPNEYLAL
jgi:hypothetical protein